MWRTYPTRLDERSWTFPLYNAPRWMDANAHPELFDAVTPVVSGQTELFEFFDAPASGMLPANWVLTETAATTGGNISQRLWETITNEKQHLLPSLIAMKSSMSFFFDEAEPEFAWFLGVASDKIVETVEVQLSGGAWHEIQPAASDLELFYAANWRWKQDDDCVLIYGFDLIERNSTPKAPDNWLFINFNGTWDYSSNFYIQHPDTKNWIPQHYSSMNIDGFFGYVSSGTVVLRHHYSPRAQLIDEVNIRLNGTDVTTATRVQIYSAIDDKAQWFGLSRKYLETNDQFSEAIYTTSWFGGQTNEEFRNYLCSAMRSGTLSTISSGASSFTTQASSTGFSIRNMGSFSYRTETLQTRVSGVTDERFFTRFDDPEYGVGFVRGLTTDFTRSATGVIDFDTAIDTTDIPTIDWKLNHWTQSGSTVTFTDNFPQNSDLLVFDTIDVDVPTVSQNTKLKSFRRTSPIFNWRRFASEDLRIVVQGLAAFDF